MWETAAAHALVVKPTNYKGMEKDVQTEGPCLTGGRSQRDAHAVQVGGNAQPCPRQAGSQERCQWGEGLGRRLRVLCSE